MIVGGYRSRTGFWEMALAAFVGTVAGSLAARLVEDYLLDMWLGY